MGEDIASRHGECLPEKVVDLPAGWLDSSHHHIAFSGSVTTLGETFLRAAYDMVVSMSRYGFRQLLLLNAHGGNIVLVPDCREMASICESPMGGMGCACELETSVMLACRPELVRMEKIRTDRSAGSSSFCMKDMFAPALVSSVCSYGEIIGEEALAMHAPQNTEMEYAILKALVGKLCFPTADIQVSRLL